MTTTELRQQRIKNMLDATNLREPNKVPVGMDVVSWPLSYAGVKLSDVINDPVALSTAYCKFLDDIQIDYYAMVIGITTAVKAFEELGSSEYVLAKDGLSIEHSQTIDMYMKDDEYDELINNYMGFRMGTMAKRRCSVFNESEEAAYEALKKAAIAYRTFLQGNMMIGQNIASRDIIPLGGFGQGEKAPFFFSPFNSLFDTLRGFKNALIDLRRQPDKVAAATKVIAANTPPYSVDPSYFLDHEPFPFAMTIYHSECFLSDKQFDELFFQPFKQMCLPYMANGAKYYLKGEGKFLNTLDRFKELPKGSMIFMLDEDDPYEAYKHIKDYHTIAAGITLEKLKYGTKQQCIDYAKKCFDTFAPGGGFIFINNKPLLGAHDANIDNLLAVYEFANEYGKKK